MTASVPTRPVPINTARVRANAPTAHAVPTRAHATLRVGAYTAPTAVSAFDGPTERIAPATALVHTVDDINDFDDFDDIAEPDTPHTAAGVARISVVVVVALLPVLGTTFDVFGLVPRSTVTLVIVALTVALGALFTLAPHRSDTNVVRGLIAGTLAYLVTDGARLLALHVLGPADEFTLDHAAIGSAWRYLGVGGGLGVVFFVLACSVGAHQWRGGHAVLAAMAFVAAPAWTLLMGTAALAPRGEELLFPLNPATVVLTLVGHLVFGLLLGLAFRRTRRTS